MSARRLPKYGHFYPDGRATGAIHHPHPVLTGRSRPGKSILGDAILHTLRMGPSARFLGRTNRCRNRAGRGPL